MLEIDITQIIRNMKAFRLLATSLLVALCAGQTSCSSKVYTPDVNVKEVNSKQYIYYQDEPFNGTVYSSDESCYMVVENGAPVKAIALHSNGAIAIETTTTGSNFNRTFYDENGNTIEEREFEKKYRDLCKSLKHKLPID